MLIGKFIGRRLDNVAQIRWLESINAHFAPKDAVRLQRTHMIDLFEYKELKYRCTLVDELTTQINYGGHVLCNNGYLNLT